MNMKEREVNFNNMFRNNIFFNIFCMLSRDKVKIIEI